MLSMGAFNMTDNFEMEMGSEQEPVMRAVKGLRVGQHRIVCPHCSNQRKKNKDRSMSVEILDNDVRYKCWHCGVDGGFTVEKRVKPAPFEPAKSKSPELMLKPLDDAAVEWLGLRKISKETAEKFGVQAIRHFLPGAGASQDCLAFPNFSDKFATAYKIRSIESKNFACVGSPKNFFGMREFEGDTMIICEGEMDCLAFAEAGIPSVSIPNGAVNKVVDGKVDPTDDKKFQYLWDNKEVIEKLDRIVIACDADPAGEATAEELSRRLGKDKVFVVSYPEGCKDANDVLCEHGIDGVVGLIDGAKPLPISGLYDPDHFFQHVDEIYAHGLGQGETTGYKNVDELYTIREGQLTVVTGIPSSGKSEFIDQLMVNLAESRDWKFAICSFENEPSLHISKLASKYLRKPFFDGVTPRMTHDELDDAKKFISNNFCFVYQADGSLCTIDHIISRIKAAVLRYGIRGAVIDPYNYIERDRTMSETDWVSEMLTKLRVFAQAHDVHIWFVAHPAKMKRLADGTIPVPTGHDISGSAAFYAKADVGLTVHRNDPDTDISEVIVWKCRFSWVGKQGRTDLRYDKATSTYSEKTYDPFLSKASDRSYNTNYPF